MPKAGGTFTGKTDHLTLRQKTIALGSGGSLALNLATGQAFTATVNATATVTVTNTPATGYTMCFTLHLTNGGSAAVSWPTSFKWIGGVAPTLTTSGVDLIAGISFNGGTTWLVFAGLDLS
jgi:hypothetical protein